MSFLKPDAAAQPAAPAAVPPPPPVMAPQGKKPGNKSQQRTFLGSDATPGGPTTGTASGSAMGGKTLLGE